MTAVQISQFQGSAPESPAPGLAADYEAAIERLVLTMAAAETRSPFIIKDSTGTTKFEVDEDGAVLVGGDWSTAYTFVWADANGAEVAVQPNTHTEYGRVGAFVGSLGADLGIKMKAGQTASPFVIKDSTDTTKFEVDETGKVIPTEYAALGKYAASGYNPGSGAVPTLFDPTKAAWNTQYGTFLAFDWSSGEYVFGYNALAALKISPYWNTVSSPSADNYLTLSDAYPELKFDPPGSVGQIQIVANSSYKMINIEPVTNQTEPVLKLNEGFMRFYQRAADPAAPSAGNVVVYAKDAGGGKTGLYARFDTGAVQQLALEP